ncbi:hypothetical protein E3P81_02989 [Wallemia ichthyophaga]|nr:hypothetical protein E3P97_03123 [Wallemia ichthyophaga]TIB30204.1 hypothetical protein E3P85_02818 [Wallemia ichthyophaga]TIB45126.1 hypothetical protein E3P82_03049 [Wallemia ichthyophaga]TIB48146.1 hypothetical protein E3P81_02989 [Wallemia ichthyophaga]TIB51246.1 hypothetical protein E3P80_03054 [Wallemia ichthyophaga]
MSTSKRSLEEIDAQPKKARFAEKDKPEKNNPDRDLDTTQDLEYKKGRRGAIKTEGYDSDSSNEGGESVVRSRHKPADNDDDDMFGDGADKPQQPSETEKAKPLSLGDIEGQEFGGYGDKNTAENSDGYSSQEGEEDEMGGELSAFNMKSEMQEGDFVDDGTYVEKQRDPHAMHDAWLDNSDKQARKRVRDAHKERLKKEREEYERVEAQNAQGGRKEETMMALAEFTQRGETVLEALQRLGKDREKSKKNGAEELKKASTQVEKFTELVNIMVSIGVNEVYDWEHEQFVRGVRKSGYVNENWVPSHYQQKKTETVDDDSTNDSTNNTNETLWEYKQSPNYIATLPPAQRPVEVQVFGPFKQTELLNWVHGGHLGPEGSFIKVRKAGETAWVDCNEIF